MVNVPKRGGQVFHEGGLASCAEAGFSAKQEDFNAFIKKLRTIRPKKGTFINITETSSCTAASPQPIACGGIAGIPCPKGQSCVDDPQDNCDPNNGGADCSGICTAQ